MTVDRDQAGLNPRRVGRTERARRGPVPISIDLADQRISQGLATILLAMMTIQIFGPISNVIQIAIIMLLAAIHWRTALLSLPKIWLVLAYPLLALASTYWSSAPDVTFRYAAQFLFTAIGVVIVAASLGPRRFLLAIYVASTLVAIGSLFSGRYGGSMEGPVLVGLTGSKNQIAFLSQITLASAVAIFLDRAHPRLLRASAVAAGLIAFMLLVQAKSAGGILTAIGATIAFLGLMLLRPFPPEVRVAAVVLGIVAATPVVVMRDAVVEQAQRVSMNVFKKDATLTGRTYLWAQADRLIEQRPIVGHGFRSVWLGKSVTTTGLLRWARLPDGRGFNFHNTFKEVTVDTGFIGLALFIVSMAVAGFLLLGRFLREGTAVWAFFFATYLTYLARSFAELIIGPFSSAALILGCIACYAALHRPEAYNGKSYG